MRKFDPPKYEVIDRVPTVRNEEKEIVNLGREIPPNDEVYQRIAVLKQRPALPKESSEPFHYDPDEPLHLPQKK